MRQKGHHWLRGRWDIMVRVASREGSGLRRESAPGMEKIIFLGMGELMKRVVWPESSYLSTTSGPGFRRLYLLSFGTCAWLFHICSRFWLVVGHLSHSEASQWSPPGLLTVLYIYILTPIPMTTSHTLQL